MNKAAKQNIAIFFFDIFDISGGGGAERFYADFYIDYQEYINRKFNLFLLTNNNYDNLKISGRDIDKYPKNIININTYPEKKIKSKLGQLKHILKSGILAYKIIKKLKHNHIKAIQVPIYREYYFYLFYFLKMFSSTTLIINLTDCRLPYLYNSINPNSRFSSKKNYGTLFNKIKIDGILTWYNNVKIFTETLPTLKKTPTKVITRRYLSYASTTKNTKHIKEKLIIFAARLDSQKDPLIFIEAINLIAKELLNNDYKVEIYGKGPLSDDLHLFVKRNSLSKLVTFKNSPKMHSVFSKSELFVSTQKYDNYPSLSIFEALANENMVIVFNEGDTKNLILDNFNGFIIDKRDKELLAQKILEVISLNNKEQIKVNIKKTLNEVHTLPNFISEIESFWSLLLLNKQK